MMVFVNYSGLRVQQGGGSLFVNVKCKSSQTQFVFLISGAGLQINGQWYCGQAHFSSEGN